MKRAVIGAAIAVAVGACAKRIITPPPEAYVNLDGKRASYRNWKRVADLCAVDAKVFAGDVQSMTDLLANLLEKTSAGLEGAWSEEQVALLEQAAKVLPIPLDLEHDSLEAARELNCPFANLNAARELNEQAKKRLADAPELVPVARARIALAKWKNERPGAQESARASCPTKAAKPTVFFAVEDEAARAEWLFCDGAKVVASPGNPPSFVAPPPPAEAAAPAPKKGKKAPKPPPLPDAAQYLDAAAKYPGESISRAPKIPKKKRTRDDGAPEPKDAE